MRLLGFLVSVAWRGLWRHRRRSLLTASAMATGVALCMALVAMTDGMLREFGRLMVDEQLGHVVVQHPDYLESRSPFDTLPMAHLSAVEALPDTKAAVARLYGHALVGNATGTKSGGAQLVGTDPAREDALRRMAVAAGEHAFGVGEVLVGANLADTLAIAVGEEVVVVTQATDGSLASERYRVRGLFRSGNAVLDRAGVLMQLSDLQALLLLPDQLHEITALSRTGDPGTLRASVAGALGSDVSVRTWWEISPQTAQLMAMQDFVVGLIVAFVFAVAAFGILNTMTMSVFERTRELGVLKALGLRPAAMVALVVLESLMLAALAAVLGLGFGAALDVYLVRIGVYLGDEVANLSMQGVILDPQLYGLVRPGPIAATVLATFAVSALAALSPAIRAARLDPVEAIRVD